MADRGGARSGRDAGGTSSPADFDDAAIAAEYIATMSGHLSRIASSYRLDFLAYLIERVTLEAWAVASGEDKDDPGAAQRTVK